MQGFGRAFGAGRCERNGVKFLIDNWTLVLLALTSGGMLLWPVLGKGAQGGLSPNEAVMLMNREKAVVVDVCEPQEYAAGHVNGAKNIPLSQLESQLASAIKNKTNPLILVCASGVRSSRAVAIANKLGFEKAHSLAGGMGAWRQAGLPIQKG